MKLRKSTLVNSIISKVAGLFSFIIISIILSSCSGNCIQQCVKGDCDKGVCNCDKGYEGVQCNQSWSSKIVGDYQGRDCYDVENTRYTITSLGPDSFIFDNIFKAGITNSTVINIPEQKIEQDGSAFTVSGSGSYSNDTLKIQYRSDYPSFDTYCELLIVKD